MAGLLAPTPKVDTTGTSAQISEGAFAPLTLGTGSVSQSTPNVASLKPTNLNILQLGGALGNNLLDILRSVPRAGISTGLTLAQALGDFTGRTTSHTLTPSVGGRFSVGLLGKEPITSLQTQAQGEEYKNVPPPLVAFAVTAGDVLNLLPFGGEANALKEIAAVNDLQKAANIGRKLGVHPDLIEQFAHGALQAKTPTDAKIFLEGIANLQKTTTAVKPGLLAEGRGGIEPSTPGTGVSPEGIPRSGVISPTVSSAGTLPEGFSIDNYLKELAAAQEKARTLEQGSISRRFSDFLGTVKSKLVDFTAPIEDTLAAATKASGIKLAPSADIGNQIDRVLRAPTLAGQFAKDNGIINVIRTVDNTKSFDQYVIAKHGLDLAKLGVETGRDVGKDAALVSALEAKYGPLAEQLKAYTQALLDKAVADGLISKELAEYLKKRYPNYVPFNRIFSALEEVEHARPGGVASLTRQTVIRKIEGSARQVESPITTLLARTYETFAQGEKNVAGRMLAGYKELPGNPFQLRELKPGESAPHTISFLDKGKKRTFATTPEIAQAAKSLNVQQLNILGKIFAAPTRIARMGITGINLPFLGANVAKDQVTAFINSSNSLRTSVANVPVFLKSLFAAVKHDALYEEMVRAGGAGTSFDISRNQAEMTVGSVRAGRNVGSKILYTVRHPSELLRAVENVVARGEEMTRLQQYTGTKQALLSQGYSEQEAVIGAAKAARKNTVDFARRGEWGTVLNSAFLYLNASIQGTRTLMRGLKTKPVATAAKIAVSALFPMATVTAWNLSDPERRAAYDDIPDYEKQNNIIIIPPHPTQDAQGKWNVIKIPLSQEINNLVGLARRGVEAAYHVNPLQFSDFAGALVGTVSPINPTTGSVLSTLTPQGLKPTLEGALNKNIFTGIPQVPDSMKDLSPSMQVRPYTSGTAREIAGPLGISPIKVEEFIKGTFGGVGSQALNVSDRILAAGGAIPKDQIGGTPLVAGILGRFNKAQGGAANQGQVSEAQTALTKQADQNAQLKTKAQVLDTQLQELSRADANAKVRALRTSDPQLFHALQTVVTNRVQNLSYEEKLMNQLDVTNGARARYINAQILKLKTPEQRNTYLQNLIAKKIVTKNVYAQLRKLQNK